MCQEKRESLKRQIDELHQLLVEKTRFMLKGSISKDRINRTKIKNIASLDKNWAYSLRYRDNQLKAGRTVYLRKERVPQAEQLVANYRESKKIIEKLLLLNVELFRLG